MSDTNFLRYYVSAQNGWNPFDEQVKKIPSIYWIMAYHFKRMDDYADYKYKMKPTAEFLASIVAPDNFSQYLKWEESNKKSNSEQTVKTKNGEIGVGQSEIHLVPGLGMVDAEGTVVIPEKLLQQHDQNSDVIITG